MHIIFFKRLCALKILNMDETLRKEKLYSRILEVDLLRGIALFFMIFDHIAYDLFMTLPMIFKGYNEPGTWTNSLSSFAFNYWNWNVRIVVRYFIVFIFLSLTGICCSFSHSNIKRGLKLFGLACIVSLVTFIMGLIISDINVTILFGLLQCVSLSLIMIGLLEKLTSNKWVYLAIGLVFMGIGIFMNIQYNYSFEYKDHNIFLLLLMQIVGIGNVGGDSFPLFLNGGQIFIGVFLGKLLYPTRKSIFNKSYSNNMVTFMGRHSLIIYIAHQVLIVLLLSIVLLICGYKLAL